MVVGGRGGLDDGKTEISGKIVFGIGAKGIFLQLLLVFFGKFDSLVDEMLYIKQLRPPLNEQTDSGAYSGFFLIGGGGGGGGGGWLRPIGHQTTR